MLDMAMQVYTGPKAIVAEQEMTPFFHVDKGVPAGCPQAALLAKAVLTPALAPWHEQHNKHIHLSSWVDDNWLRRSRQQPSAGCTASG